MKHRGRLRRLERMMPRAPVRFVLAGTWEAERAEREAEERGETLYTFTLNLTEDDINAALHNVAIR